jgi:hypothetical protein
MTKEQDFWDWFIAHDAEFFTFDPGIEPERERLFDKLEVELQKVHPKLTFAFGPRGAKREFVISAGGLKSGFPAVASLVSAAPRLERWNFIAFRPRRPLPCVLEIGGGEVSSGEKPGTDGTFPSFSLNERTQKMGYVPSVPGLSSGSVSRPVYSKAFVIAPVELVSFP